MYFHSTNKMEMDRGRWQLVETATLQPGAHPRWSWSRWVRDDYIRYAQGWKNI